MSQPPFSLLQSFFHTFLSPYNYKALDGCSYASIRPTLTNMFGHLRTRYYSSVKKCPFPLPFSFYSTDSLLSTSKVCVFSEAFSDKKTLQGRCLAFVFIYTSHYTLELCFLLENLCATVVQAFHKNSKIVFH